MSYESAKTDAIQRSHRRWEQTRACGQRHYIWVQGVIQWGGLMASGLGLGQYVFGRFHIPVALITVFYAKPAVT